MRARTAADLTQAQLADRLNLGQRDEPYSSASAFFVILFFIRENKVFLGVYSSRESQK
jgi:hypothetical protein